MYLNHFGLNQLPFGITPDPSFFFTGNKRGEILAALLYAVEQGDGIIKVTGEVGSGKTMLCRMLEGRLPGSIEVIYLVNPTLSREQVIYTIAGELDLPINGKRVDEIIRMLHTTLIEKHISGEQVVLLVEEAQAMSLETLEEIRLFSNLETAHHKLLQIVLFGQPELDTHLNLASMRQLKERITNSFIVPPLTHTNVPEYLKFRLRAAGYVGPDLFDKSATNLIGTVSEGIVRRISILADKSLLAAFADNANTVSARHVKAAIRDSEFPRYSFKRIRGRLAAVTAACAVVLALGLNWSGLTQILNAPTATRPAVVPVVSNVLAAAPVTKSATLLNSASTSAAASAPTPLIAATAPSGLGAFTSIRPAELTSSVATSNPIEQRLHTSNIWLSSQSPERYSVQVALVASADQNEVNRILHKMESDMGLQEVYIYASPKGAPTHFGILVGSYANRADALKMLEQLSSQWGYKAQLRTIGGITREMTSI